MGYPGMPVVEMKVYIWSLTQRLIIHIKWFVATLDNKQRYVVLRGNVSRMAQHAPIAQLMTIDLHPRRRTRTRTKANETADEMKTVQRSVERIHFIHFITFMHSVPRF